MIYAVAIDDEQNALDVVSSHCAKLSDVYLLKCFTDPVEGLDYINTHASVNTVFLDVKMPKLSGFELAKQLPANVSVVLTAASGDFSLKAFDIGAVDYLLKPFSFERFKKTLAKARLVKYGFDKLAETSKKLVPGNYDVILVKCDHKNVAIRLSELLYVEAARNYIILFTTRGKILALNTLKSIESFLLPFQFVRVHKSYIVSFQYTEAFEKNKILLRNTEIPIGESYRKSIQDFLSLHSNQI
jgi:DNA-binding LytR/AlgR family response regulator